MKGRRVSSFAGLIVVSLLAAAAYQPSARGALSEEMYITHDGAGMHCGPDLEFKFGANLVFDVPMDPGNPDEDEQQPEDSGLTCEIQYSFSAGSENKTGTVNLTVPNGGCVNWEETQSVSTTGDVTATLTLTVTLKDGDQVLSEESDAITESATIYKLSEVTGPEYVGDDPVTLKVTPEPADSEPVMWYRIGSDGSETEAGQGNEIEVGADIPGEYTYIARFGPCASSHSLTQIGLVVNTVRHGS